jgi:hypothetical protein
MMARSKHPKKEVEKALSRAEDEKIKVEQNRKRGHRWGSVGCQDTDHAKRSVWSTPTVPGNHANDIDRYTDGHKGHGH